MGMELTPKVFRDVQFREKLRGGYHPEDVDEFLEQAAVATEELLDRLQRAEARAQRAEQSLEDASANDETIKRVLLMAQRTADQAVREAREEAERLLAEARVQAQKIVAEAEERGRRAYDAKVADAKSNLERAEAALRKAQSDAEELSRWVTVNRAQLLEALQEAASVVQRVGLVEEPAGVGPLARPAGPAQAPGGAPREEGGEALNEASSMPEAVQGGGGSSGSSSQWDPHFLDNLEADEPASQPASPGAAAGEDTRPGAERAGTWPSAVPGRRPEAAEPTVAFDERALEDFFSDQDLGPERGSRFRRRS